MAANTIKVTQRVQNQGVYIGAGFASENSATPFLTGQVGQVVVQNQKAYQYVQFDASVADSAVVAGSAVCWFDLTNFIVTTDLEAALGAANAFPAGIALGAVSASNYGWIQVYGLYTGAVTDGGNDAVAGDFLIVSAASDGALDRSAQGTGSTFTPMGIATGSEASSAVNVWLIPPHNGW